MNKFTATETIIFDASTTGLDGKELNTKITLMSGPKDEDKLAEYTELKAKVTKGLASCEFTVEDIAKKTEIELSEVTYVRGWLDADGDTEVNLNFDEEIEFELKPIDDYIIPIVYPDYQVAMPEWARKYVGKLPFGHSGVLIINGKTGITKYYEYGRYDPNEFGVIRKVSIPNAKIEKGIITENSLKNILSRISKTSGQNGRIEATIHRGDYYLKALNWMSKEDTTYRGSTQEEYIVRSHNCVTFSIDLLNHLKIDTHNVGLAAIPDEEMEELQEDFADLRYNPLDNSIEIESE